MRAVFGGGRRERSTPKQPDAACDPGLPAELDADAEPHVDAATTGGAGAAAEPRASQQPDNGDYGPVFWQPLKRTPVATSGTGGLSGDGWGEDASGEDASGEDGSGEDDGSFGRDGKAAPALDRRRPLLAGLGIATLGAAAAGGWYLFSGTPTTHVLQVLAAPRITAHGGASPASSNKGGSGGGGNPSHSAPAVGGSEPVVASNDQPPAADPSTPTTSRSVTSRPSPSPTPSSFPSPSPSPSPTSTGPVLPPGYLWHRFSAALMGTAAGFEIGMPTGWQQTVTKPSAHLNLSASGFQLTVGLASWLFTSPVLQAEHLQGLNAKAHLGYKKLSLGSVGFKAIGGYTTAAAAELKFSWPKPTGGSVTELIVLVTLATSSGSQPYTFTLTAPSTTFSSASATFYAALATFRPLPAA